MSAPVDRARFTARRLRHRASLERDARRSAGDVSDPVFVLAAPRTGSTLLVDLLSSLDGVSFRGEVLNPRTVAGLPFGADPDAVERHLRRSLAGLDGPVRGAKLLFNHLEKRGTGPSWLVERFGGARFVVLYRRSLAERFVSNLVASSTGRWQQRAGDGGRGGVAPSVVVDAAAATADFARTRARYDAVLLDTALAGRSVAVAYEDVVADAAGVFGSVLCPFLGVAAGDLRTDLVKQVARPLAEVVSNWDEVAGVLSGPGSTYGAP